MHACIRSPHGGSQELCCETTISSTHTADTLSTNSAAGVVPAQVLVLALEELHTQAQALRPAAHAKPLAGTMPRKDARAPRKAPKTDPKDHPGAQDATEKDKLQVMLVTTTLVGWVLRFWAGA